MAAIAVQARNRFGRARIADGYGDTTGIIQPDSLRFAG